VVARQRDKKVNSYKLALACALNDVVLSYPDLYGTGLDVCVPLRKLAEYWLAYYWPFVDPQDPVMQGPRAMRGGVLGNDVSLRPALTSLRSAWKEHFGTARPSDGFLLVAELRVPRIAASYPPQLQRAYRVALTAVMKALAQPIRYAGPGGETHGVFPPRVPQPIGQGRSRSQDPPQTNPAYSFEQTCGRRSASSRCG
jgi:hypothetical protein